MIKPAEKLEMQPISYSITEISYHLLVGETGDDGNRMSEGKVEAWPRILWAFMTAAFRK